MTPPRLVVLDPGHGGKDPGAVGRDPWTLREADVAWAVTVGARAVLEGYGHRVETTRPQARYVSVPERARFANDRAATVFVSVHCNAATSRQAHGVEVLHYGSGQGKALAGDLLEQILKRQRGAFDPSTLRNRGLKRRRGLGVLRLTRAPAALVEMPFLSNPDELRTVASAATQGHFAQAVAGGVHAWISRLGRHEADSLRSSTDSSSR